MLLSGCGGVPAATPQATPKTAETAAAQPYTGSTLVQDVISDAAFGDYGRLIFPVDLTIPTDLTLENLDELLVWYNNVNPDRTVEIANYRIMQRRIEAIRQQGTPAEIDIYPGLAHGFGLGEGTVAEGWLDHAVTFWQENI